MTASLMPLEPTRAALRELKNMGADIGSAAPSWDRILTVRDHEGALDPSRPIVIGDRGTGKSFWTAALVDPEGRRKLAGVYGRLGLTSVDVAIGFGADEFSAQHPVASELKRLLDDGYEPEVIWRAVLLALLPDGIGPSAIRNLSWDARAKWVAEDAALRRNDFVAADRLLAARGRKFLFVFDALDTVATSWADISRLVRGLLQIGLFLRSSRTLNVKLFLRPDMADDPSLWAVGDSSKLRHDEVTLAWTRRDLHALLIQYLSNNSGTFQFVDKFCKRMYGVGLSESDDRREAPFDLIDDEGDQEIFFALIAGSYMGTNATKGKTYTWVPNHLANAKGYAAPRSFLLALAVAAEHSKSAQSALDVSGIQEGVRQASKLRMNELREDYRWIDAVFRPLKDMLVPVEKAEVISRWRDQKVIRSVSIEMTADTSGRYLPPPRISNMIDDSSTHAALLETLDHLAIIETTADGRFNMPDLFRLAAGVKRKGGVRLRP
ncbi:hypothetical protein [Bosea sp. FBZP-16]|uniref:hypothetical protein n=1 Tax=Bosea sp. FBZP-16 TaxID=2065382 RepID=UPI00131A1C33|nr:hypothetical protein [Bosea sp. FBZP-16]